MDLDGHQVMYIDDTGGGSAPKPTPKPTPKPKPASSGSGIAIVIDGGGDDGGNEQVYIPDPRQYYQIQEFLKNSASNEEAISQISKYLFPDSKVTIKQVVQADKSNNMSVLASVTSQEVSKSTQETIINNCRNQLVDQFNEARIEEKSFIDKIKSFGNKFVDKINDLVGTYHQDTFSELIEKKEDLFHGKETGIKTSTTVGETEKIFSLFSSSSTSSATSVSNSVGLKIQAFDTYVSSTISDDYNVSISIGHKDDFNLSVSLGTNTNLSIGIKNYSTTFGITNKKIYKTVSAKEDGVSLYTQDYIKTDSINSEVSTIATLIMLSIYNKMRLYNNEIFAY